ncbi:MAG TPA: VTT domain-containing protein [Terriglobales bacterium]|nr:VTT domain-containing protein [Terriglobales bacterium]
MLARLSTFAFAFSIASLLRLGGPGLILLGLADNSVVPLPGSMDVFTIWLAASHRSWWFYYAIMATLGAVLGGYVTYALAKKGGKETLERKLPEKQFKKVLNKFESKGFATIMISAMVPPPFPIVPILLAAGALQYPRKKFLAALALGRGIRFLVVAGMGAIYGDAIVSFFSRYYKPALFLLIGFAAIAGIFALYQYMQYRKRSTSRAKGSTVPKAA